MKWIFGVVLMVSSIFAVAQTLPPAQVSEEEGFVTVALSVQSVDQLPDGSVLVKVANLLNGKTVGFSIRLDSAWKASQIDGMDQYVYWGSGAFINEGAQTGEFVSQLASIFNVEAPKNLGGKEIGVGVVGLVDDPAEIFNQTVRTKFFFNSDSDDEDLYSEVFVNFDLKNKTLALSEKDLDYRAALVASMAGHQ